MYALRHGTGRPLVLVHGLGSSHRTWDLVAPALSQQRELVLVDLPGFGRSPALEGDVTIATLTDALAGWLHAEGLGEADVVGSSMGARMVLELARRGHRGKVVALDPGGFWNERQVKVFGASITASVAAVRRAQPLLPALTSRAAGRTALLAQFSAAPWSLPQDLVLRELRGFTRKASPSLDAARRALVSGPPQAGAPVGTLSGVVIGWGRQDRVTTASQAQVAAQRFPDARVHWFEKCGHFPHWDQPDQATRLILESTG